MKFYHGTTMENASKIIEEGFAIEKESIWRCSKPKKTYLVSKEHDEESGAMEFATDCACIAAAMFGTKSTSLAIIELFIPEKLKGSLEPDKTSEYMKDCYQIDSAELNRLIKEGTVKVTVHERENAYNEYLRPFYLANVNTRIINPIKDPRLAKAAKILKDADVYLYDIADYGNTYKDEDISAEMFGNKMI